MDVIEPPKSEEAARLDSADGRAFHRGMRESGLLSWARVAATLLGALLSLEAGCTCTGVHLFSRIYVLQKADAKTRLWAWSRADLAGAELGVISFDEGSRNWVPHLTDAEPFPNAVNVRGGVSSVSWKDASGLWHDRVYYVGTDGRVHEGGYDGDAFRWRSRSEGPPQHSYYGALLALASPEEKSGVLVHIAAIRENEPGALTLDVMRPGSSYSVEFQGSQMLKASSNVFGAVFNGEPYFFVVSDNGRLVTYADHGSGWQGSLVKGGPEALQGDGAAVAWSDGSRNWLSALVRDGDEEGRLLEVRFDAGGEPTWSTVESSGHWGSWANTIAVAPNLAGTDVPPGYELAFAMDGVVRRKRLNGQTNEWLDLDDLAKPPDIEGDAVGPVALAPGAWNMPNAKPEIYMVGAEVSDIGYAFVSRNGESGWHNLLDPIVSTGEVAVNLLQHGSDHLTESAAHERNGTVLVAAARMPRDYKTSRASDVLAAWSSDHAHTFGGWTSFPSSYQTLDEGRYWMQGDPTVALLSDARTGYVMFHEVRFSPSDLDAGCDATGVEICRSRISLYRGTSDPTSMRSVVDLAGDPDGQWELRNAYSDKESCASPKDQEVWFLDHPVIAVTSDDVAHIAWYRQASNTDDNALLYRALDASGSGWLTKTSVLVFSEGGGGLADIPYITADATLSRAYVLWAYDNARFAASTCTPFPAPSCSDPQLIGGDDGTHSHGAVALQTLSGTGMKLRTPWFAFASSPTTSGKVFLVYAVGRDTGSGDVQHAIKFVTCDVAADASVSCQAPETITPVPDTGDTDSFGPTLAVLGDNTVVVNYYNVSPQGGHDVQAMVLLRDPSGTWSAPRRRALPYDFDLTVAPRKCLDQTDTRFVGDYHMFLGSLTHAHYMRADPVPGNPLCTGTCLWTAAVSDICW